VRCWSETAVNDGLTGEPGIGSSGVGIGVGGKHNSRQGGTSRQMCATLLSEKTAQQSGESDSWGAEDKCRAQWHTPEHLEHSAHPLQKAIASSHSCNCWNWIWSNNKYLHWAPSECVSIYKQYSSSVSNFPALDASSNTISDIYVTRKCQHQKYFKAYYSISFY